MENDILDGLKDVGYTLDATGLDENVLEKALDDGAKSIEYTRLVKWFSKELQVLFSLEEHVNAITSAEDSSSFLLELSSFLKELGCQYKCLTEGHMSERLQTRNDRCLLLDYLIAELQAARMIATNSPDTKNALQVTIKESPTAADLKKMLLLLNFPKPPLNITPAMLFGKVEKKVTEVVAVLPGGGVGKPLFTGVLSETHWHLLEQIQKELLDEYRVRREMLLKRLDVTVQSFQWSDRMKNQEDQIAGMYLSKRKSMVVEPNVRLSYLLAARQDLAIIEKTSNANVRRNTQSPVNKVMIGRVPDRGGRPSEQMPPPPEMPSWQQRNASSGGGGGGGRGDGGRGGGRGGDRGGRVQGGWNQGGQDRGGYQGNRDGGNYVGGGGWKDQQGGGYRGGGRGGYQDSGYQGGGGGGGRGNRGGRGGYYQDNMSR